MPKRQMLLGAGSAVISPAYIYDSFEDVEDTNLDAHTPDTGGSWTEISSGDMTIQSNQVGVVNTGNNSRAWLPVPADSYTIDLEVKAGGDTGYDEWGILFNYQDATHFHRFILNIGDSKAALIRQDGTDNELDSAAITITEGNIYNLRVVKTGSIMVCTVDAITLNADEAPFTGLNVGLMSFIDGASAITYDNFTVTL